jgi:hypothetical protein
VLGGVESLAIRLPLHERLLIRWLYYGAQPGNGLARERSARCGIIGLASSPKLIHRGDVDKQPEQHVLVLVLFPHQPVDERRRAVALELRSCPINSRQEQRLSANCRPGVAVEISLNLTAPDDTHALRDSLQ